MLVFLLIFAIFQSFFFSVVYFAYRIYKIRKKIILLDASDFNKEKNYYRDIIEIYSPAVLNYIDNFTIDINTVIATVMYLELKGLVTTKSKIEVTDKNPSGLDKNSTYIYNLIKHNAFNSINITHFENLIKDDCIMNNLIENTDSKKKKVLIRIILIIAIYFSIIGIMVALNQKSGVGLNKTLDIIILFLDNIVMILVILFPIIAIAYIVSFSFYNPDKISKRSSEAKKLNIKMEGLKKYITDYGNLDEKSKKELILWEDYLIYSVLFKTNKKITSEYIELLNTQKNNN